MSKRYEVDDAATDLQILTPHDDPDEHHLDIESDMYALVIGNPWSSAFAIAGSPEDLREFGQRVSDLIQHELPDTTQGAPTPSLPLTTDPKRATEHQACGNLSRLPAVQLAGTDVPSAPEGPRPYPLYGDLYDITLPRDEDRPPSGSGEATGHNPCAPQAGNELGGDAAGSSASAPW
ncbi:hypothetical protein [Nonomuraea sp. NPDC049695]|uniref:hypothetical protein n=1 Tax=Nonomuraea sp. NPDC049695 TaxID=3154734 RepID=UPI00341A8B0C